MTKRKILKVENLTVNIAGFTLKNISFNVYDNDYIIVLGNSGAGKSVLLETIAGMYKSKEGRIYLEEKNITFEKIQKRKIGIVYQDNTLFRHLSVRKNLEYGLKNKNYSKKDINLEISTISQETGIEELLERNCEEGLSGGEIQRISLARSLLTKPKLLLLDEPLSALDVQAREEMQNLLKKIHRNGQPVIHVTHNPEEAFALATYIIIIEQGKITQQGSVYEILNKPQTKFIANIMGCKNFFKGSLISHSNEFSVFKNFSVSFFVLKEKNQTKEKNIKHLIISGKDIIIFRDDEIEEKQNLYKNFFEAFVYNIIYRKDEVEIIGKLKKEKIYLSSIMTIEYHQKTKITFNQKIYFGFHPKSAKVF